MKDSCITHAPNTPYVDLHTDYMQLYGGSFAQVVIVQRLETSPPDEWIPLTFEDFIPMADILSFGRWDFNNALKDLIALGHVIKHEQGEVYRLNVPVVQKALDEQFASRNA